MMMLSLLGLQGRVLSFPNEAKGSFVIISPMQSLNLREFTLCMRIAVEYLDEQKIILFSYYSQSDELRILREAMGYFGLHTGGKSVRFALPDLSTLGSHICVTWESVFGLTAFWVNGKSSIRKVHNKGHILQAGGTAMLGQDQGAQNMSDQQKPYFVGEITDLYMWDYILKSHDIQKVFQAHEFPRGNIFDWKILSYKIIGNVMVLPKS
uniref:Pentraxin family member n=1 Tax=Naja naja TaxID=35670 RepID=A0A8C6Y4N5_NAJNA